MTMEENILVLRFALERFSSDSVDSFHDYSSFSIAYFAAVLLILKLFLFKKFVLIWVDDFIHTSVML